MFLSQDQVQRIHAGFQLLGLRGTTIFGSSGDGGSHFSFQPFDDSTALGQALNQVSCQYQMPVFPTASPFVISVGGEDWVNGDSSNPEAWNGSGGGFSWQFNRPAFQASTVDAYISSQNSSAGFPSSNSYNVLGRAYPDISAVAVDGTSQSSPIMAGIFSMIVDQRLSRGLPALGFIGPRLYQISSKYPGEAFQDITNGNSQTSCDNGFPATVGWDAVTGFGRPIWSGLLKHFASDATL
jgi:tripeptidyl-peptidase-1